MQYWPEVSCHPTLGGACWYSFGDFKRKRKKHGNREPVAPSFFETVFLSWASLFINAREIISSQGSLFWRMCK